MKQIPIIVLVVSALLVSVAEAAPKKRTRNANRVGAYAGALVSMSSYSSGQEVNEQAIVDFFASQGVAFTNLETSTDDSDIGYEAVFGFRFNRYVAAELGLLMSGDLETTVRGDFSSGASPTVPGNLKLAYNFGGPVLAAIGILPLNDKFEVYARAGMLFASIDRENRLTIDGEGQDLGGFGGDSTEFVYGAGLQYHVNVMFSIRAEYMVFDEIGDPNTTGTEDMNNMSLGLIVRF